MKLRVVYAGEPAGFLLYDDETDRQVGTLWADSVVTYGVQTVPTVESLTRYQTAKLVIDGKSLKRLQRSHEVVKGPICVSL